MTDIPQADYKSKDEIGPLSQADADKVSALIAERDRLREAIKKAPCLGRHSMCEVCVCWKGDALAGRTDG